MVQPATAQAAAAKKQKKKERPMGYPAKVQRIRRPANQPWYVTFPNAIAPAIGLRKGETVAWVVASRSLLVMVRKDVPPARKPKQAARAEPANERQYVTRTGRFFSPVSPSWVCSGSI